MVALQFDKVETTTQLTRRRRRRLVAVAAEKADELVKEKSPSRSALFPLMLLGHASLPTTPRLPSTQQTDSSFLPSHLPAPFANLFPLFSLFRIRSLYSSIASVLPD